MWLEAIISQEDFASLAAELMPLRVHLGHPDSEHYLLLSAATDVELVEGRGLRIRCNAEVQWPVLGIHLPIEVEGLTALVEPSVPPGGDSLSFGLQIEEADVAWVPAILDAAITGAINESLRKKSADLSWNFTKTLSHEFALPELLRPLHALGLAVGWGKVRTTREAMVLAVSFHASAIRDDRVGRGQSDYIATPRIREPARRDPRPIERASATSVAVSTAVATALALTTAYVILRGVHRLFAARRSNGWHLRAAS